MPLEKQSLNNFLPNGFETLNQEGYKENFSEDKIATGYEKDVPDIVSGPNLNNLIDVVGKNTNTLNNYVEYLNGMPINNVPTTDENGQLNYINLDDKLTKKQITNCILEIPQRIKYTLENGTLTIKAGSVVIVPYGVEDLTSQYPVGSVFIHENFRVYDTQFADGKFFVWAELVNDINSTPQSTVLQDPHISGIDIINNKIYARLVNSQHQSGDGSNIGKNDLYYNINANTLQLYYSGAINSATCTLPMVVMNKTQDIGWTSIKQVFNGVGYIGYFYWVDKGVKCLLPKGRNSDGTLKNLEYTTNFSYGSVSPTSTTDGFLIINESLIEGEKEIVAFWDKTVFVSNENPSDENISKVMPYSGAIWYNPITNICYYLPPQSTAPYQWIVESSYIIIGKIFKDTTNNNIIKEMKITANTVNLLKTSDAPQISGWGMPSNKYIDLTVGKIGSTYIAPANGYFKFAGACTAVGYIGLENVTKNNYSNSMNRVTSASSSGPMSVWATTIASKGDIISIAGNSNMTFVSGSLKFIYAEGEV